MASRIFWVCQGGLHWGNKGDSSSWATKGIQALLGLSGGVVLHLCLVISVPGFRASVTASPRSVGYTHVDIRIFLDISLSTYL